jgi:putative restriction endonuclease
MRSRKDILEAVDHLAVFRRGDRRAPHKPLLLLLALARLRRDGTRKLSFREVDQLLRPLLDAFAPPVKDQHEPKLPYWHLQSDGLWAVDGRDELPLQKGNFPKADALKKTSGGLPKDVADALVGDPALLDEVAEHLLDRHFPESLREDVLDAVGLELGNHATRAAEEGTERDPAFRSAVLRAYGYRCALTGYHLQLRGAHVGMEAAHVHWVSHGGPNTIANGLALQSTMHKLLDAGAWSLTDDRRVLVSQDLTGADETTQHLRSLHGKRLNPPLKGFDPLGPAYIRWHREPTLGGVFRGPALPCDHIT